MLYGLSFIENRPETIRDFTKQVNAFSLCRYIPHKFLTFVVQKNM